MWACGPRAQPDSFLAFRHLFAEEIHQQEGVCKVGQKPVGTDMIESVLAKDFLEVQPAPGA